MIQLVVERTFNELNASPPAIITAMDADGGVALGLRWLGGVWWDPLAAGVAVVSREAAVRYFGVVDRARGRCGSACAAIPTPRASRIDPVVALRAE